MFSTAPISHSRIRYPSSSDFSPMMRPAFLAAYLEKARWGDGFACPHCGTAGEPFHFENRPGVLRCRKCRQNTGLTVGTVMERSHTPLNVWFWAAYLVASQTPGMSAVQFQRQLSLSRYETAFQILHKLRSGMVRPNQDRIGGQPKNHVEVDETWVGGRTRGEGRGRAERVLDDVGAGERAPEFVRQAEADDGEDLESPSSSPSRMLPETQAMNVDPNHDVFVSWLPLYHDMGLIGAWLGSLYFAVPVSIMSPLVFLTRPESWLWEIHLRRGTLSGAPNFAFDLCASRIDDAKLEGLDLSSARMVVNGAEPVRPESVRAFCNRFEKYGFDPGALTPVYRLAENSVGLAFPPPGRGLVADRIDRAALAQKSHAVPVPADHSDAVEVVACGMPIPGHQVRVVDDNGREVADRHQGRLQFTGPSATRGYYRNDAETKQLYDGDWLETGDLAYIAGGDVFLIGRVKDIIIRGGRNIYPHEIEAAVGELDGVRRGCVVAFASSSEHGEKFVVVAETRETPAEVREQLRRKIDATTLDIAGIAPDDVVLAPPRAVMKTSSGKVRRSATAERYLQGRLEERGHQLWWQLVRMGLSGIEPGIRAARRAVVSYAFAAYWCAVFMLLAALVWPLSIVVPRSRGAGRWCALLHVPC